MATDLTHGNSFVYRFVWFVQFPITSTVSRFDVVHFIFAQQLHPWKFYLYFFSEKLLIDLIRLSIGKKNLLLVIDGRLFAQFNNFQRIFFQKRKKYSRLMLLTMHVNGIVVITSALVSFTNWTRKKASKNCKWKWCLPTFCAYKKV